MDENEKLDVDELLDGMEDRLRDMIEDAVTCAVEDTIEDTVTVALEDAVEYAVADAVTGAINNAVEEIASRLEFALQDGAFVGRRQYTYVLSRGKSKMLCCRGGLRVDGTCLMIQEGLTRWSDIARYSTREEALEALAKVKNAMLEHKEIIEL